MLASGNSLLTASGGIWQQSRDNPTLPATCGLDVALILDLSGSVGRALPNLKQAADTFVNSLVGTPSRMALFSFSDARPGGRRDPELPGPDVGLDDRRGDGGQEPLRGVDGGWRHELGSRTRPRRGGGRRRENYDIAVVITDGNPTRYSTPPQGPGSFNRLREVENGIFSANALKVAGHTGRSASASAPVSPTATPRSTCARSREPRVQRQQRRTADYYQTTDYAAAGAALRALALGNCEGRSRSSNSSSPPGTPERTSPGRLPPGRAGCSTDDDDARCRGPAAPPRRRRATGRAASTSRSRSPAVSRPRR